jgi:hypothetical protein
MFAQQQMETAKEEQCSLCGACRYVISRSAGTMSMLLRQSSAGKNMNMEAEDIVEIRHQATTGEDTGD